MTGSAPVEAEDVLVEIALQVLGAQAVVDAERPGLEVGEDAVDPRQDDMGGHVADHMGLVAELGRSRIAGPAIGLGGAVGGDCTGRGALLLTSLRGDSAAVLRGLIRGAA